MISLNYNMVKFVSSLNKNIVAAPLETRTDGRIYAFVGRDDRLRSINFYDEGLRCARIVVLGKDRLYKGKVFKAPFIEIYEDGVFVIRRLNSDEFEFTSKLKGKIIICPEPKQPVMPFKGREFNFGDFNNWVENNLCNMDVTSFIYRDVLYSFDFLDYDSESKLKRKNGEDFVVNFNPLHDFSLDVYYLLQSSNGRLYVENSLGELLNAPILDGKSIKDRFNEIITLDW